MPPRTDYAPGWTPSDGLNEREARGATGSGRISNLAGRLLLLAILIAGSAMVFSGAFSDRADLTHPVILKGHSQLVEAVAFSPDGKSLASCGWDNSVQIWDVARLNGRSKAEPVILPHSSVRYAVAFSPDGTLLAAAGQDSLTIWTSASGQYAPLVEKEGETYRCVAFSPDGGTLALGSDDGKVQLWDVADRAVRAVLKAHVDVVRSIAFSPDGARLVSSGQDREIMLWDVIHGAAIRSLGYSGSNPVQVVAFAPDGRNIAVGEVTDRPQDVVLLDTETGAVRTRLKGHRHGVNALAFSPSGRMLATAGVDRCIKIWNLADGMEQISLKDGVGTVRSLSFSVDGAWLAFAGSDSTVKIWDLANQRSHLVGRPPRAELPRWTPRRQDPSKVG
jgi:WD40 repeat protein